MGRHTGPVSYTHLDVYKRQTLCRTIMGLYSPSEGTVFYNNIPVNSVSWTYGVSAVFQKYCQYKMTLRDNICISDIDKENNDSRIKELCRQCRVNLGQGYDTIDLHTFLGRDFDGIEISGGQWQRIATVSYTHLDVYKRQELGSFQFVGKSDLSRNRYFANQL